MATVDARALGERIAEARHRANLTQADLAQAVGLDRSVLAKIETGSRRVTALELSQIADYVEERIEWFVEAAPAAIVSHRNTREPGMPSPAIDRLIDRLTRNIEFALEHDTRFSLPPVPDSSRPDSVADVELAAARFRELLGLDKSEPVLNISDLGARLGLLTFSFDLGTDGADAASVLLERGAVLIVNGHLHGGRRRLALVHEWGHCHFADEYSVDWRVAEDQSRGVWESQLDLFARAVLLPPDGVQAAWSTAHQKGEDLRTTVVRLGSRFRVDMSTMARRLSELGYIDHSAAEFVRMVRTKKADIVELGLVTHEELAPIELASIFEESVVRLYRQEIVSPARASDLLLDVWGEDDFPELPQLPESAAWTFVS